jgi:hypothetical protein
MDIVTIPHVLGNCASAGPIAFVHVELGFALAPPAMGAILAVKRSDGNLPHYVLELAHDFESFKMLRNT